MRWLSQALILKKAQGPEARGRTVQSASDTVFSLLSAPVLKCPQGGQ
jgi:hypothetical protein